VDPDFLKDSGAFVFQGQAVQKEFLLGLPDPEDGGITVVCNSGNCPPNNTVSYPKVLDYSTSNRFAYLNKTNKVTLSKCISLLIPCYLHRKLSVGCKAQHSITQLQTM